MFIKDALKDFIAGVKFGGLPCGLYYYAQGCVLSVWTYDDKVVFREIIPDEFFDPNFLANDERICQLKLRIKAAIEGFEGSLRARLSTTACALV